VEVDFKDLTNLKITPTGDKKSFPGFFVGFQHISEQIQKLVDYMKGTEKEGRRRKILWGLINHISSGEQKITPHSSVTVIAGVNKCGKTTLLTTIIPAFIHHHQLQPIIIYTSCENFDCSTLSATCAGLYDLLFAKLRIYSPTATSMLKFLCLFLQVLTVF
jgi:predicted AAA+ superfamily ATPase